MLIGCLSRPPIGSGSQCVIMWGTSAAAQIEVAMPVVCGVLGPKIAATWF